MRAWIVAVTVLAVAGAFAVVGMTSAAWSNPAFFKADATSTKWFPLPFTGQMHLSNSGTPGKCVDDPSRLNTLGVQQQVYDCNKTPAQIWTFGTDYSVQVYKAYGQWNSTDPVTPSCLTVKNASTADGAAVVIAACAGSASQQWSVVYVTTTTFWIVSKLSGGANANGQRCLGIAGTGGGANADVLTVSNCALTTRNIIWTLDAITAGQVAY